MKNKCVALALIALVAGVGTSADQKKEEKKGMWKLLIPELQQMVQPGQSIPKQSRIESFSHGIALSGDEKNPVAQMKPSFQDIHLVRMTDAATPLLLQAIAAKRVFKEISLDFAGPTANIRLDLENAVLSSVQFGGSLFSDSGPMDQISLSFEKMKVSYADKTFQSSTVLNNKNP